MITMGSTAPPGRVDDGIGEKLLCRKVVEDPAAAHESEQRADDAERPEPR
jgi:hypothetical protein